MRHSVILAILKIGQAITYIVGMAIVRVGYLNKAIDIYSNMTDPFVRISKECVHGVSRNIRQNGKFSAGKQIRFTTYAEKVKVIVLYRRRCFLKNMSYIATSGIDIYQVYNGREKWCKCIAPDSPLQMLVTERLFLDKGMKDIILYLPPFAQISKIILADRDELKYFKYKSGKRSISIYGSSISQGCAASRPGLAYFNLLSRSFDADIYNCAFSEGARGERFVIDNILLKGKYDVVIVEYDHNSPTDEFMERHLGVYQSIRNHTDVPIIFLSRISGGISNTDEDNVKRISIIQNTLQYVKRRNDKRVWFINGDEIVGGRKDLYLVDDRHPNDLGMKLIADAVGAILREKVFDSDD